MVVIFFIATLACNIALGSKITEFGKTRKELNRQIPLRPTIDPGVIMGSIIYIDSYSNVITNISQELFEKERNNFFVLFFLLGPTTDFYDQTSKKKNQSHWRLKHILHG